MISLHSEFCKERGVHFERLVSWYDRQQFILVYIEDNIFNFSILSTEVRSTETNIVNFSQQPGNEYGRASRS